PYYYNDYYPGAYSSAYVVGPSTYALPSYSLAPSYAYATPEASLPAMPAPVGNTANIRVLLPAPNAQLLIDGAPTTSMGEMRLLGTTDLKPGEVFHYDLTAAWAEGARQVTETRRIDVMAGRTTMVDFTRPAPRPPQ